MDINTLKYFTYNTRGHQVDSNSTMHATLFLRISPRKPFFMGNWFLVESVSQHATARELISATERIRIGCTGLFKWKFDMTTARF